MEQYLETFNWNVEILPGGYWTDSETVSPAVHKQEKHFTAREERKKNRTERIKDNESMSDKQRKKEIDPLLSLKHFNKPTRQLKWCREI